MRRRSNKERLSGRPFLLVSGRYALGLSGATENLGIAIARSTEYWRLD